MMRKLSFIAALVLLFSVGTVLAQSDKQPQMSDQEKAMMAAWQKFMTPGAAHKALEPTVGTFDLKVTAWMAAGAPPQISAGVATSSWILGGRYIQSKVTGSFNGQPFEGIGYTGYDNGKKQYFGTWIDNMGTGLMTSTGNTTDGKTWNFTSTNTDPMTGKDSPGKSVTTIIDADHYRDETWAPGQDGKLFKMMQIDYTRKK